MHSALIHLQLSLGTHDGWEREGHTSVWGAYAKNRGGAGNHLGMQTYGETKSPSVGVNFSIGFSSGGVLSHKNVGGHCSWTHCETV